MNYEKVLQEFIQINGWDKETGIAENEGLIEFFMNRGIKRVDTERFLMMQARIANYFAGTGGEKAFLKVQGLMITFGTK
jgi:hypothetical protein